VEIQWFRDGDQPCKRHAGISELNFNDLRGTAATKFYVAGIEQRIIAEILVWEEDHVAHAAATRELIAAIDRAEKRTESAKPAAKPFTRNRPK
jgi:hypothetical protein